MYERFTDRARKVMQLANQEAQRFNHEYIDAEHILLGLIAEGTGLAGEILKRRTDGTGGHGAQGGLDDTTDRGSRQGEAEAPRRGEWWK